jgi:transposase
MLPQLPAAVRVFLCSRPTDMRKSFDGLFGMVREFLGQDPLSGHLFLFLNRRRDRVKILFWERDGMVIWYKRLEAGTFQQPDPAARANHASGTVCLCMPSVSPPSSRHSPPQCRSRSRGG